MLPKNWPRKALGRKWGMRFVQFHFFFRLSHLAQDYELEMHGNATCIPIQDTRVLFSSDFLRVPASQVRVLVPAFVFRRPAPHFSNNIYLDAPVEWLEWSLAGM